LKVEFEVVLSMVVVVVLVLGVVMVFGLRVGALCDFGARCSFGVYWLGGFARRSGIGFARNRDSRVCSLLRWARDCCVVL
jgi:hypothetical protein